MNQQEILAQIQAKEAALYCTYPIDYKMYTIIIIAF